MFWHADEFSALGELWLECCRIGLADNSQAGKLRFATAAMCALRQGRDPMRLFASMVNRGEVRTGEGLKVALEDEDRAIRVINGTGTGPMPRDTSL